MLQATDDRVGMCSLRRWVFACAIRGKVGIPNLCCIEAILGTAPPVTPPDVGELVESKLMQCDRCDAGVALLIFAPGVADPGRFEDYARRMYQQVVQMNVPTYVIGPALGDGPLMDRPADILKIWPEREAMQRLRPNEFNPLVDALARAHGADGSARRVSCLTRARGGTAAICARSAFFTAASRTRRRAATRTRSGWWTWYNPKGADFPFHYRTDL